VMSNAEGPWIDKRQPVIDAVLKANPGWQWHRSQGANDPQRFEKSPPPAPPPAPPAPPAPTPAAPAPAAPPPPPTPPTP
jgi:hypothetical protein